MIGFREGIRVEFVVEQKATASYEMLLLLIMFRLIKIWNIFPYGRLNHVLNHYDESDLVNDVLKVDYVVCVFLLIFCKYSSIQT